MWTSEPRAAAQAAILQAGDLVFSLQDDGNLVVFRSGTAAFEPIRRYHVADSEDSGRSRRFPAAGFL